MTSNTWFAEMFAEFFYRSLHIKGNRVKRSILFSLSLVTWRAFQVSHFFGLTKFHDISMIFSGFLSKFPGIFSLFLKYDFQVVLNIYANLLSFIWTKIQSFQLYSKLVNLPFYLSNLMNFVLFQGNQGWIFSSHQVFPGFMSFFHDIY